MTEIARIYLGNIDRDSELANLVSTRNCIEISLSESDRHKGRIYVHADSGETIGIIKSRDRALQPGDLFKTDLGKLLLIQLKEREVMVLDFSSVDSNIEPTKLIYLGHVLGNHHYPITLQENKIYIQLVTDKAIAENLIRQQNIPNLKIDYQLQSSNKYTFSSHSHN